MTYALPRLNKDRGFTLIELMISTAILLVIGGAAFSLLIQGQKSFTSTSSRASMHGGVRSAAELMAQEISQAGVVNLPATTITAAISAGSRTVSLNPSSSSNSLFAGERVVVDGSTGVSPELVTITAVGSGTFTATFANAHPSGATVNAHGTFLNGIWSSSGGSTLILIGDILGDGTLVQVQYDCDLTSGTLKRSVTPITPTATAINTSDTLVDNVVANPGGTNCFQYQMDSSSTYKIGVGLTITVQTKYVDPLTRTQGATVTYPTMTKTFLNMSARNVISAIDMSQSTTNMSNQVFTPPSSVPLD